MSGLFYVELRAVSPRESLELSRFVGRPAEFQLTAYGERRFRGVCAAMDFLRVAEEHKSLERSGLATYELVIVPTMWRLTQRVNNRLFQHVSIPDIVDTILKEWQILCEWRLDRDTYPKLELRTQYAETDFAFLSRLLEEAGISFWFVDHGETDATLFLGDAPQKNDARPGLPIPFVNEVFQARAGQREFVTNLRLHEASRPGRVTLRDYDFFRPRHLSFVHAESDRTEEREHEQYIYTPGAYLREGYGSTGPSSKQAATEVSTQAPSNMRMPVADDLGVARSQDTFGQMSARLRVEALHADRNILSFETSASDLSPGTVFSIAEHPRDDITGPDRSFLMIRFCLEGEIGSTRTWRFSGSAVPISRPYRPTRRTPKPRIHGVHTAVVVGPASLGDMAESAARSSVATAPRVPGDASGQNPASLQGGGVARLVDDEIYVDEFGRVRVQFPWDRENEFGPTSSVWMRTSQGWGGAGYGFFTIPRVGHEVLVSFIDGDPDCPLVVGRVHNMLEPVPFKLPDNKTVSTWKTSSSPGGGGFNELRFDDAAGREHVFLQAQKDMDQLVKGDLKQAVGRDRASYVQNDDAVAVGGQQTKFVNFNELEATGLCRAAFVGVNRMSTIGAEDSTFVGSRWSVTVARGLTRRLSKELERVAEGVGGVLRTAATGVLGWIPNDPMAGTAEAALSRFGRAAIEQLSAALSLLEGFEVDQGPAPTSIEVVDRQIKLSTGEASIVLDGPNVTITAQGAIAFHAMEGISLMSEQEVAVLGREKVAVISATDDIIVQSGKLVRLNPFEPASKNIPDAERLGDEHLDKYMRCGKCGERLVAGPNGWFCRNDIAQTPRE